MAMDEIPTTRHRARPAAHELARYESLFAARTHGMRSSAMREMMALTERPEVISLAGGLPDTSTFAPELYAKLMSRVAAESTARALQYGPTGGMAVVMEGIVKVMEAEGTVVDCEDIIVTTGGQQVIDLVCKTLIDPGDVIVAEAPTYPGAVPTFSAYEADVVQIEMDEEGMPIDALEATLDALAAEGRRPKFIYTIPNFQNPGGVTMSLERRRRLVELARERELLILEDNPYGLLRYEGEQLPTLYSLDASSAGRGGASDLVIYLGTFSKILSPGVRLGWAVAPRPVLEKLNLGKQGADLCSSPVTQLFVAAYLEEQDWMGYIQTLRDLYRKRRDTMHQALEKHFGEQARWTKPQGGLFIWATLPEYIDTTDLLARALESENVAFVPGRAAYMDGRGASSMRLNFAGTREEEIREGIRRIGKVVDEQVGLFGTLTRNGDGP
jgi:2-aminoadipate transaminase